MSGSQIGLVWGWQGCPIRYLRTHNLRVCLYIAYIACGSASLYIKTLYSFCCALVLSAAATVANIKLRYDAKKPQFAIFGTPVICVFYSMIRQGGYTHDSTISNPTGLFSCFILLGTVSEAEWSNIFAHRLQFVSHCNCASLNGLWNIKGQHTFLLWWIYSCISCVLWLRWIV